MECHVLLVWVAVTLTSEFSSRKIMSEAFFACVCVWGGGGCGFEPHWRHCVVVLELDTFILA